MKTTGFVLIVIALFWFLLSYLNSRPGRFYYGEPLGQTGLRFEVYHTRGGWWDIMPGSSYAGPGIVKVLDSESNVILQKKIKSNASDIFVMDGELVISGEGSWLLKELLKRKE